VVFVKFYRVVCHDRRQIPRAVSSMAVLDEAHWQYADVAAGRAGGPAGDF
jgi:hypothetical protein